jgi:hypothetical protein
VRRARIRLAGLLVLAGAAAGCMGPVHVVGDAAGLPRCVPLAGDAAGGTILMAQSVPTAAWLPCVRQVPPGWTFYQLLADEDGTTVRFLSDRDGDTALAVLFRRDCDLAGASEVPSEQPEMRRYERVTRVTSGYGGERHYVFTGGCVTFRFDLRGATRAEPVATITEAFGFISRQTLARQVRESTDGRLELDPGPRAAG